MMHVSHYALIHKCDFSFQIASFIFLPESKVFVVDENCSLQPDSAKAWYQLGPLILKKQKEKTEEKIYYKIG